MRQARVCADLDGSVDGVAECRRRRGQTAMCRAQQRGPWRRCWARNAAPSPPLSLNLSHWALFHTAPELEAVVVARGGREARLRSDWLTRLGWPLPDGAGLWLATVSSHGPRYRQNACHVSMGHGIGPLDLWLPEGAFLLFASPEHAEQLQRHLYSISKRLFIFFFYLTFYLLFYKDYIIYISSHYLFSLTSQIS
jgi:hypothetical protein